jgi:hypothetical protein
VPSGFCTVTPLQARIYQMLHLQLETGVIEGILSSLNRCKCPACLSRNALVYEHPHMLLCRVMVPGGQDVTMGRHEGAIRCVQWVPQRSMLVTGGWDQVCDVCVCDTPGMCDMCDGVCEIGCVTWCVTRYARRV